MALLARQDDRQRTAKRTAMAKTSDYRIVTFQRQPGLWRANMTPIVQPATITRGDAIRGFVTAEDSKSEEDAVIAAHRAIRELDG
ncbi:hypothetical protein [Bradyrhizobium roseum]|uniref:hypothetical protein n=1 Tax=Bradyrhizobium roseum TaxID=3056648 RepID=UPI00262E5A83|nr:hypothetical protein [Bradyrhizobium roseus]WKA29296.1 hypothetical protein QUH67_03635 [Bradyrhizobium roseus]